MAVALFTGSQFQPTEMFSQGVTHQGGPVSIRAFRGLVGGVQQLFIQHDLNDLHMWSLFHSIIHIPFLIAKNAATVTAGVLIDGIVGNARKASFARLDSRGLSLRESLSTTGTAGSSTALAFASLRSE